MENGTHGRVWHTDEEDNIAFSFVVKADCKIDKLDGLTTEIAEIIAKVLKKLYNIEVQIKSPNDIVYNEKKLGGILTETKLIGENVKYIVIGIGINTNQQYFNEDISNIASSIRNEFGIEVDNVKVITEFCNLFERILNNL